MKRMLLMLLGATLAAPHVVAQSGNFDPPSGVLTVPCVRTPDPAQNRDVYYQARLRRVAQTERFTLEQLRDATYDSECTGAYDLGTRLYTGIVNADDKSYHVRMRRDADGSFVVEAATLRGAATTSLWVASNGANTVYLAGAVHLLRDADFPLPRAYDEAYAKSAALWFETDFDDPNQNGSNLGAEGFDALVRDAQGKKLSEQLTPVTYGLLRDYMASTWKLDIATMDHWAAQTLTNTFLHRQLRMIHGVTARGVDRYLADRAIADGKPVGGLETMASHYAILQAMDEGFDERTVDGFLYAIYSGGDLLGFEQLVAIWRRGDTTEFARRGKIMHDNDFADYLLLYANRNDAWIPRIEAMLNTAETEMVVVGAAHMAGPDGLIAQLRRRGYRVEQY